MIGHSAESCSLIGLCKGRAVSPVENNSHSPHKNQPFTHRCKSIIRKSIIRNSTIQKSIIRNVRKCIDWDPVSNWRCPLFVTVTSTNNQDDENNNDNNDNSNNNNDDNNNDNSSELLCQYIFISNRSNLSTHIYNWCEPPF